MTIKTLIATALVMTALGIGMVAGSTTANAYSQTSYISKAICGYYISKLGNDSLKITCHSVTDGSPLADSYFYHVTKVNRSGHKYRIYNYIDLGGRNYFTLKLSHYKKQASLWWKHLHENQLRQVSLLFEPFQSVL